ncbi:MAG: oligosaccharide flippase family protein [Desulfomonilaceae bacterium]
MTPNLKLNIIANYAGSIWSAIMGVVFVPLYIKFMGIESYGLVGFFATLISMFSILDMGLAATMNREMARRSAIAGQEQASRDLLRTLETIYWIVAIIVGSVITALSFPIAKYWVNPDKLSVSDVQQAVMIMGLVVVFRWPFGLYQGGLMGLQKQVLVNILNSISGTFRGLGAVLVLWLVSPTIQAFFIFQIVVSAVETLTSAIFLWHSLPLSADRPKFRKAALLEVWRFAGGMMGINVVAMILTNSDKIILSKMLTLETYGYYMLAWTGASAISRLVGPIFTALFPRLSQLVASGNTKELTELYHKSCQFMSVMVIPAATVLALFSYQILLIWTGDANIASKTSLVMSLLIIGTACNGMMIVPYAVQLAYGWTSLAFWVNVVSIIILIPFLIFLTNHYGMIGGPIVWAVLNTGYVLISIRIMHWRILKGELWRWYRDDMGRPLISSLAVVILLRAILPTQLTRFEYLIFLACITCFSYGVCTIVTPTFRTTVFEHMVALGLQVRRRISGVCQLSVIFWRG